MFNKKCCNNRIMNPYDNYRQPIMEPTITNCIEKEFYHEVPHCCPYHTHVINKHIYTHTYTPQYTSSEEDVVINNDCGGCQGNQGFNNFYM